MLKPIATILLTILTVGASANDLKPGEPFDYPSQAFYPDRWVEKEVTAPLFPWVGEEVVLLTPGDDLDRQVISNFVGHLDRGWSLYHDIIGKSPRQNKSYAGAPTIAIMPASGLTCGYGCGYIGATGIEMTDFDRHYKNAQADSLHVPHAYFYEMGRNYFVFGNRHSCFTTGFAVFMRYVCMDTLGLKDIDLKTQKTIYGALSLFEKNDMTFLDAMTSFGSHGEKGNRLKDAAGKVISPSDQNVLYASLMLTLRKEFGGNDFVKRFYSELHDAPSIKPTDTASARQQSLSLLICASIAAETNLTPRFTKDWKLELDPASIAILNETDWKKATVEGIFDTLTTAPPATAEASFDRIVKHLSDGEIDSALRLMTEDAQETFLGDSLETVTFHFTTGEPFPAIKPRGDDPAATPATLGLDTLKIPQWYAEQYSKEKTAPRPTESEKSAFQETLKALIDDAPDRKKALTALHDLSSALLPGTFTTTTTTTPIDGIAPSPATLWIKHTGEGDEADIVPLHFEKSGSGWIFNGFDWATMDAKDALWAFEEKTDLPIAGVSASGKSLSLEDYRGKITLLNFWGTH